MSPRLRRWQGIALCLVALVATGWLAATNQLILYIHPRYVVFTVIMGVIGLVLIVGSFATRPQHDDDDDLAPRPRSGIVLSVAATALTLAIAVALLVVPPATLTTATADQRVINASQLGANSKSVAAAASAPTGASARFTVADWASLLRQSTEEGFYQDKPADVTGFVTVDKDDPDNVFYVSRFVITCCAVDAQPLGVPVYLPGWKAGLKPDDWVRVKGAFDTNPSQGSKQPLALRPTSTTKVGQPSDPYLY